jgi:cold shock protein
MDRRVPTRLPVTGSVVVRTSGRVTWFCSDRGFGFLAPDDGGEDVFVAWPALPGAGFRQLVEGQRVTFTPDRDQHGPTARDVQLA